jgi:hypothetical protein
MAERPNSELVTRNVMSKLKTMITYAGTVGQIRGKVHLMMVEPLSNQVAGAYGEIKGGSSIVCETNFWNPGLLPNDYPPVGVFDIIIDKNNANPDDPIILIVDRSVLNRLKDDGQAVQERDCNNLTFDNGSGTVEMFLCKEPAVTIREGDATTVSYFD